MMNIYPQTLDIQDGTPDLKTALIVETMEKTEMIWLHILNVNIADVKLERKEGLITLKLISASELKNKKH